MSDSKNKMQQLNKNRKPATDEFTPALKEYFQEQYSNFNKLPKMKKAIYGAKLFAATAAISSLAVLVTVGSGVTTLPIMALIILPTMLIVTGLSLAQQYKSIKEIDPKLIEKESKSGDRSKNPKEKTVNNTKIDNKNTEPKKELKGFRKFWHNFNKLPMYKRVAAGFGVLMVGAMIGSIATLSVGLSGGAALGAVPALKVAGIAIASVFAGSAIVGAYSFEKSLKTIANSDEQEKNAKRAKLGLPAKDVSQEKESRFFKNAKRLSSRNKFNYGMTSLVAVAATTALGTAIAALFIEGVAIVGAVGLGVGMVYAAKHAASIAHAPEEIAKEARREEAKKAAKSKQKQPDVLLTKKQGVIPPARRDPVQVYRVNRSSDAKVSNVNNQPKTSFADKVSIGTDKKDISR